jgi:hypothetical protein
VTIPPSYLDIGMGGHFEEFGGCLLDPLFCAER